MKKSHVLVPWQNGLHMSNASQLVRMVQGFRASVRVVCHDKTADARSILGLLLLGATFHTPLTIEIAGEDEADAVVAVETFFSGGGDAARLPHSDG